MWEKRFSENFGTHDSVFSSHLRDLVASKLLRMEVTLKALLHIILTWGQMHERAKMRLENE